MSVHEYAIPVRDLDAAGKPFRFPVRAAWIRSVLEGTDVTAAGDDGRLELRLSKSGNDVVIRGSLQADLAVPCARCLEPAPVHVAEDLSALAVPGGGSHEQAGEDEADLDTEQADMIGYDGETLVLDDLVRDELLLGIPMIPLCSEGCPGIHPVPGEAKDEASAIDPRLRPLLRLKKRLSQ
jgi:uncharacterized protein